MSNQAFKLTTVDLLRHGDCEGGPIYRGVTDSPLSSRGWRQMEWALADLEGWERIVTSPLQRCRLFAERFAADTGLPLEVDDGFREIHFGHWEGRTIADVWRDEPTLADAYYRGAGDTAPTGGESLAGASERFAAAWQGLLERHRGRHVLLVAHGGAIRLLLSHLLGAPVTSAIHWDVSHGALARVTIQRSELGDFPRLGLFRPGEAQP